MDKTKIFYITLSLFLGLCLGSVASAQEEGYDEYIPLWSYSFPNARIDEAVYIPQLRFDDWGRPIAESGLVILGVTEAENTVGQSPKIHAIGLEADTGTEIWRNTSEITSGPGAGGQVLSITPILLRNNSGQQRAAFVYFDQLRPGIAQIKVLDVEEGDVLDSLTEDDTKRKNTVSKSYFKPLDGDFNGDGRIDNILFRRDQTLIQAIK